MNKNNNVIELKNLWKVYKMGEVEVNALRDLSLNVGKEDFLVVLGTSGSGKSTLMNMIGALDVPTKGKILLDGKDISQMDESHLAQLRGKKIGFVFQQFNLMHTLSAKENVVLPMIFQKIPDHERQNKAEHLLKLVGLGDRMHHKPSELSGGQQQRVAIARALANDPEIILADEPTGNLDSATGKQILNLLDKLHFEEKKTIILVTHDIELVKYAHRVIYLKDGSVVKEEKRRKIALEHGKNHRHH